MSDKTLLIVLGGIGVLWWLHVRRARAASASGEGGGAPTREPLRLDITRPLGQPDRGDWPWWADSGAWAG